MKKNPPRRPSVPAGFQAVWISKTILRRWDKSHKRRLPVGFRKAHWRVVPISQKAQAAREAGKAWIPVLAFERELQEEFDLAALDPVYRYHRSTDLIRSLSSATADPLHGLVWGTPFTDNDQRGTFNAIRVWYVVRDMNLDRYYLYARSAHLGKLVFDSLLSVKDRVEKLKGAIEEEYEEKAYMELVKWAGWTAFGKAKMVKDHKKFRKVSKERGFDFDEKHFKFIRKTTRWEREQAQKALRGVSGVPSVLARDYGGNYRRFLDAMGRLTKGERRRAYDYLSWAVGEMERALDKKRKARKPGKWRE